MNEVAKLEDERFEFTIDGKRLYAPRERMTASAIIRMAIEQGVLKPAAGGYALKDRKNNTMVGETLINLEKRNAFHPIRRAA